GRHPGRMKPDILAFGGESTEPFIVYDRAAAPKVAMTRGTSFAAPSALRMALGIRAHFGARLSPLALRALLIHVADDAGHHSTEVGWGRVEGSLDEVALCGDGMVRVVYQGELHPSQYLRALIPLPGQALPGMVYILA